jgi:riboflavin biosynthesis pyrimidine reductase
VTSAAPTALEVQLDDAAGDALPLPAELEERYGGPLRLEPRSLYANFVQTVDGVVAIPSMERSNALIAAGSETDRFLMGLLRASADAVLIGSGTLAGSPRALWRAEGAFPPAAEAFAELRRRLDRPRHAEVAVVTGSGALDPAHPLLEEGALVLTTAAGARRLRSALPAASTLVDLGDAPEPDAHSIVGALRARGHERILSEAGPHLFRSLLAADDVDELFLTVSPLLLGRGPERRLGLVAGEPLAPPVRLVVRGLRRDATHLFLRYALTR